MTFLEVSLLIAFIIVSVLCWLSQNQNKEATNDFFEAIRQRDEARTERDDLDAACDECYQWYSKEYDEHEETKEDHDELIDDLEAAQELLAESDRANKQLFQTVELKNKIIAKLERHLNERDDVLRTNFQNIVGLAKHSAVER